MTATKRGIVLMNLGSPDSTSVKDVRRYLDEFLMDGRVIDMPYLFRALLVKGLLSLSVPPNRLKLTAPSGQKKAHHSLYFTEQLQQQLQQYIDEPVEIAMRSWQPTPAAACHALMKKVPAPEEVIAVPLYPHYAMASYETAVEYAKKCT